MENKWARYSYTIESQGLSSLMVYYAGYQLCPPGHNWGPGIRDHYLLHHIRSGEGIYEVNGRKYHLQAGDTFLSRPGDTVFYQADFHNPWSYCWVGFHGSECSDLLLRTDFSKSKNVIHTDFGMHLTNCILGIYEQRGCTLADTLQMTSGLYQLMACMIQFSKNQNLGVTSQEISLQNIAGYICSRISSGASLSELSIKEISKYANMSQSTLYRLFMSQMGVSPVHYITMQRMKRACELLRLTDMPVLSVAYSVGYPNGQHFSKCFKKFMGISPSEYAHQCRVTGSEVHLNRFMQDVVNISAHPDDGLSEH